MGSVSLAGPQKSGIRVGEGVSLPSGGPLLFDENPAGAAVYPLAVHGAIFNGSGAASTTGFGAITYGNDRWGFGLGGMTPDSLDSKGTTYGTFGGYLESLRLSLGLGIRAVNVDEQWSSSYQLGALYGLTSRIQIGASLDDAFESFYRTSVGVAYQANSVLTAQLDLGYIWGLNSLRLVPGFVLAIESFYFSLGHVFNDSFGDNPTNKWQAGLGVEGLKKHLLLQFLYNHVNERFLALSVRF